MFWWPVQGVTFATLPVAFACGFIKLLLLGGPYNVAGISNNTKASAFQAF